MSPNAAPANLAHEAARRALRLAFADTGVARPTALSQLVHVLAHEAARQGASETEILDGLTRALTVACHDCGENLGHRRRVLDAAHALTRSQLRVLDALMIPRAPFARAPKGESRS